MDYQIIIPRNCIKKLGDQMDKDICMIEVGKERGTGFFVKIPFPNLENMLPVLITNNHIINNDLINNKEKKIKIRIEEEDIEKEINLNNRLISTNQEYDTTIIEIKDHDNINNFMKLDERIINDIINNKNENIKYKDSTIYIIQYPEGLLSVSFGVLDEIYDDKPYNFLHKCCTRKGSSGSPVINLSNKIIGIHKKGYNMNNNEGTFLNYPIKEFIAKNYIDPIKNKNKIKEDLLSEFNYDYNNNILLNSNTKKEKNFIIENSIIFKKYKVMKLLNKGDFSNIYRGSNISNKESVAIKFESKKSSHPILENEACFLYQLRGTGIPEVLSFGKNKFYNILVEPLLGKSLFDIFKGQNKMSLNDICFISFQIIERIQWVHSKGFIHGNIEPGNFLIGRKDKNMIYLIDFGLSKKYRADKTGKHIKFCSTKKLIGNDLFASNNASSGVKQSRRDDLESIAYTIIFLLKGELPWQNATGVNKLEKNLNIYNMKKKISVNDLCKDIPSQIKEFTNYVKLLEFEEKPDYYYLRGLITSILNERNIKIDLLKLSWIKSADINNIKNKLNRIKKDYSYPERSFKNISKNISQEKNKSQDNYSGKKINYKKNYIKQKNEDIFIFKDEAGFSTINYKINNENISGKINYPLTNKINFNEFSEKK